MPTSAATSTAPPASAVARVLADCASSTHAHKECAKLLWSMQAEGGEAFLRELLRCLNHALLVFKVPPSIGPTTAVQPTSKPFMPFHAGFSCLGSGSSSQV